MQSSRPTPDPYNRRTTSESRGKTQQRIMDLQHAPGELPGIEGLLDDAQAGSIAAGVVSFIAGWVDTLPITSRRAYERSLILLLRDFDANGPAPSEPAESITGDRLIEHCEWRTSLALTDPGEFQRAGLHIGRLVMWCNEHCGGSIALDRPAVKAIFTKYAQSQPIVFHEATEASQLRDTSGDATKL